MILLQTVTNNHKRVAKYVNRILIKKSVVLELVVGSGEQHTRARPDWAYEFPDRTGPDTQICLTGPAGPD